VNPYLDPQDIADAVLYVLGTPPHVQVITNCSFSGQNIGLLKLTIKTDKGLRLLSLCRCWRFRSQGMWYYIDRQSSFGGLVVSMLASGTQTRPKSSDFFRQKNPQHAFLWKGSKAVCPMSQICGMLKNPVITWKLGHRQNLPAISRPISSLANRGLWHLRGMERLRSWWKELRVVHRGPVA
jgi:hypothetical protein